MVYIRDKRTFKVTWFGECYGYSSLPLGSDDNATGTITVSSKKVSQESKGDLLCLDNKYIFVIDDIDIDEEAELTTITVKDILNLFNYIYPAGHKSRPYTEDYIVAIMTNHYKTAPYGDTYYQRPYLDPIYTVDPVKTPIIEPDYTEGTYFKEDEYFRKCGTAVNGVRFKTTLMQDKLRISVTHRDDTPHIVILGDGHHFLVSKEFDKDFITKVTVTVIGTSGSGSSQTTVKDENVHYYLYDDGTLHRGTPPSTRISGRWINRYVECSISEFDKTKAYDAGALVRNSSQSTTAIYRCNWKISAQAWSYSNWTRYAEFVAYEEMVNNTDTYKIEFDSDVEYKWQDRVKIRFEDGKTFTGVITAVTIDSDSDMYHYKVGNLPSTITEKLKKKYDKMR